MHKITKPCAAIEGCGPRRYLSRAQEHSLPSCATRELTIEPTNRQVFAHSVERRPSACASLPSQKRIGVDVDGEADVAYELGRAGEAARLVFEE